MITVVLSCYRPFLSAAGERWEGRSMTGEKITFNTKELQRGNCCSGEQEMEHAPV